MRSLLHHPADRRDDHDDLPRDAGITVAELTVVMAVLGLVGTLVATTVIMCIRIASGTEVRLDNASAGEVAMQAVSKVLRTAVLPEQLDDQVCEGCAETAVVTADGTRLTFYANLDNGGVGPSLVTLEVVEDADRRDGSGVLVTNVQPPIALTDGRYTFCDPTRAGCTVVRREVARGLVWPQTVFSYYDFAGTVIPFESLPADRLSAISSVDVSVRASTAPAPRFARGHMVQRVRLPNSDVNVLVDP